MLAAFRNSGEGNFRKLSTLEEKFLAGKRLTES